MRLTFFFVRDDVGLLRFVGAAFVVWINEVVSEQDEPARISELQHRLELGGARESVESLVLADRLRSGSNGLGHLGAGHSGAVESGQGFHVPCNVSHRYGWRNGA